MDKTFKKYRQYNTHQIEIYSKEISWNLYHLQQEVLRHIRSIYIVWLSTASEVLTNICLTGWVLKKESTQANSPRIKPSSNNFPKSPERL